MIEWQVYIVHWTLKYHESGPGVWKAQKKSWAKSHLGSIAFAPVCSLLSKQQKVQCRLFWHRALPFNQRQTAKGHGDGLAQGATLFRWRWDHKLSAILGDILWRASTAVMVLGPGLWVSPKTCGCNTKHTQKKKKKEKEKVDKTWRHDLKTYWATINHRSTNLN